MVYRVSGKRFCQGLKFVTANFIGGYKLLILDTCWTLRNLDVNRFTRVPAIPIFFIPDFVSMYPMYLLITRRVITRNSRIYIIRLYLFFFLFLNLEKNYEIGIFINMNLEKGRKTRLWKL